ncbi:MAG: CvpA family protein [Christensenellales bacterium]
MLETSAQSGFNIIDIVLLVVIAFCLLIGSYKGLLHSLISLGSYFVSVGAAYLFHPLLASSLHGGEYYKIIMEYTDGGQRISDVFMINRSVASLTAGETVMLVKNANLPAPIDALLEQNLNTKAFSAQGLSTVTEYFVETISVVVLNIICFLLIYILVRAALAFILNGVHFAFRLPMLRHFDALTGGCFGAVRGFLAVFVIMMIVPVVLTLLPFDVLSNLVETSWIGNFFYRSNFLLTWIKGVL